MLSKADSVDGQGVGSAYLEQVALIKEGASDLFEVTVNGRKKANIVHVHSINPTYFFKMKKCYDASVVYCHFLPDTLEGSIKIPKIFFALFKRYVVKFYKKADYLVVVNPIFIEPLTKIGVKKERIRYIPNYVSKEQFYKLDDQEIIEIRNQYGYLKEDFIVLGAGQVQTRKGVVDFVECAKRNPQMKFVWCGGFSFGKITDGYKELKALVDTPPSNVKFLGIIPRVEMNKMFNMANLLFMPSFNELFPMSILEAVNSYKPVLLRDLDLYKDILFGCYLVGTNVEEFCEQLQLMNTNHEAYQAMQMKSKQISDFYSKENVLKIWVDFYTSISNS